MASPDGPILTSAQRREIERGLQSLAVAMARMDRIEACGWDCRQHRAVVLYLADQLQRALQNLAGPAPSALQGGAEIKIPGESLMEQNA